MGNTSKKSNIIIVGLDNSGKSTLINYLKPQSRKDQEVSATVGFKVETFNKSGLEFTVFDMSGQGKYRQLWEKHYSNVDAIIFVIDSSDELRFGVAKNELELILENSGNSLLNMMFFVQILKIRQFLFYSLQTKLIQIMLILQKKFLNLQILKSYH